MTNPVKLPIARLIIPDMDGIEQVPYMCECGEECGVEIDELAGDALFRYAEEMGMDRNKYYITSPACHTPRKGSIKAYADHKGVILGSLYLEDE